MDSYTRRNRHLPSVIPHAVVSTGRKNDQVHLSPLASPAGSKNKRCLLKIYVTMVSLCFFCLAASLRACLYNEQALDLDALIKEKNHLHTDDKHADNVKPAARTKTVDRTRQKSEIINNHSKIRHNPDKPTDGSNVSEKSKSFSNLENSAKRNDTNDQNDMQQEGSAYLTMYGAHRVQPALDQLPKWLKDYFQWHSDQVQNANNNTKYLVATCLDRDQCGGFSDRIRPLPYMLLVASRVDRVLCIYWTKPFKLEALMKPPKGGMDWRCPADIESVINRETFSRFQERMKPNIAFSRPSQREGKEGNSVTKYLLNGLKMKKERYSNIQFKDQDFEKIDKALNVVNAYSYKGTMPLVDKWFHMDLSEHIYRVMFEPVDEIARSVNATMTRLGLVENQYTSVHVRARYPTGQLRNILGKVHSTNHDKGKHHVLFEGKYKSHLLGFAQNALECGMLLDTNSKIFFSSDSLDLTEHVLGQEMKSTTGATITPVGIDGRSEIKHLEAHHSGSPVEHVDFYPMVEDLMILGGSKCVAHGVGSFGAFGAGLSGNRCRAIHRDPMGNKKSCPSTRSLKLVMNVTDHLLIDGDKVSDSIDGRLGPADGWFWPDVEKIQKCFKKGCTAEDVGEELARMSTELSRPY